MSKITTHILDTSKGEPAKEVTVILYQNVNGLWEELAKAITNDDGRIPQLLQKDFKPEHGAYKLRFETKEYFDKLEMDTFYPCVEIVFEITRDEHYHIPLLLNPFGYSTYRGS